MSGKWICGKCAREVAQGVDDGQIPEHHRTCHKRAQTEPTDIQFAARRSGKSQALIDSMLAQANERGIRVEVVYPQTEPTDAQIEAVADSIESFFEEHVHMARRLYPDVWKRDLALVVLKDAFTAGQEDKP